MYKVLGNTNANEPYSENDHCESFDNNKTVELYGEYKTVDYDETNNNITLTITMSDGNKLSFLSK